MPTFYGPPSDGTVIPEQLETALAADITAPESLVGAALEEVERGRSARDAQVRGIICRGDSQTAGQGGGGVSYPLELARRALTIPVEKRGYPGETPKAISTRQGSTPFLVTFPGGSIPATGSAAITIRDATTDAKLYYGAFAAGGVPEGRASIGTVAGIRGEIKGDPSAGYTFNRTTAGDALTVSGEIPFVDEWESLRRDWNQIVMIGRNTSTAESVVEHARRITRYQTDGAHLVLSVLTGANETAGTAGYEVVMAKNAALSAEFGARFVDVRRYMIDEGLAYLGITPTAADTTAINGDTIPPSLLDPDLVHPNANGYRVLAKRVHDEMVSLGWTGTVEIASAPSVGVDNYDYRYVASTSEVADGGAVNSLPSVGVAAGASLAQATEAARPTLTRVGEDGYLNFDGVDDYMRIGGFSYNGPLTVMLFARMNNAVGASKTTVRLSTSTGNPQAVSTVQTSTNLQHNHSVRGSATLSGPLVSLGDGAFHAVGSVWNGATSVASIDDQSVTGDAGTVAAMDVFSLGDSGAGVGFADYDVAEVIVWKRALSVDELTQVAAAVRANHAGL